MMRRHSEAKKGFGKDQLDEMQKIIDAEKSDLLDVLAHVAYALAPLAREDRATKAKVIIICISARRRFDRRNRFIMVNYGCPSLFSV